MLYIYYVYILASKKYGTLYTGVTNNLYRRVYEHKKGLIQGFSKKYKINKLVYFEECKIAHEAIMREKQIKAGSRSKKLKLIESDNPQWDDIALSWF